MFDPGRTGPEKGTQMDASVNMKMSPDEHRLIRSAVEEAKDNALLITKLSHSTRQERGIQPGDVRDATQRAAKLTDLLGKL